MDREAFLLRQDTANWVDEIMAFDAEDKARRVAREFGNEAREQAVLLFPASTLHIARGSQGSICMKNKRKENPKNLALSPRS